MHDVQCIRCAELPLTDRSSGTLPVISIHHTLQRVKQGKGVHTLGGQPKPVRALKAREDTSSANVLRIRDQVISPHRKHMRNMQNCC